MSKQHNYVVVATTDDHGHTTYQLDYDRTDAYFQDAYIYEDIDLINNPEHRSVPRPLRLEEIPSYEAIGDRICLAIEEMNLAR